MKAQVLVMVGTHECESSGKAYSNTCSEKDKDFVLHQSSQVPKAETTDIPVIKEETMENSVVAIFDDAMGHTEKVENSSEDARNNLVKVAYSNNVDVNNQGNDSDIKLVRVTGETMSADAGCCKSDHSLNFYDFSSATDMKILGMERLKTELQSHGLKCGGTLQERAVRLFLLKSTPLDKLPKNCWPRNEETATQICNSGSGH